MSIKSFPQYRAPLFVDKSEHIMEVTHGNDGELYALCYHPRIRPDAQFPVRFTMQQRQVVSVRFHPSLFEAQREIEHRIASNGPAHLDN